jgi:hypothetical protein
VAGDFGVGRDFLDGGQVELAEAHAGGSGVNEDAHCSGLPSPSQTMAGTGRPDAGGAAAWVMA